MKSHNIKAKGFTLVEIMVTLVVTGILVAISVVAYGDYKHKLLVSGLKSDLTTMAGAMENFRTFNNGYSTSSLPTNVSTYQATNGNGSVTLTDGVTIAGGSSDGKTFCIDAVNSSDPSTYYYIDSYTLSQGAQSGSCVDSRPVPQNLLAAMVSNSSIRITWDA
ncbi:prepilin-type N-terminal cleavage/methylation domain-containing protein, partial [Candidatus Saccharibacteria bacterium]|nr:prepilin-type N-terminal cleavage/methylation domain-containing protein [Candidatus Saccharibacteria bacterium]